MEAKHQGYLKRYHDQWHKTIEIWKAQKLPTNQSITYQQNNCSIKLVFRWFEKYSKSFLFSFPLQVYLILIPLQDLDSTPALPGSPPTKHMFLPRELERYPSICTNLWRSVGIIDTFVIKLQLLLVISNTNTLQIKSAKACCSIFHFNFLCNSLYTWDCT